MPPQSWATPEQTKFLVQEDPGWSIAKNGETTLKSFYTRTTNTFLSRWPETPDEATLKDAEGDVVKAQELVVERCWKVCFAMM